LSGTSEPSQEADENQPRSGARITAAGLSVWPLLLIEWLRKEPLRRLASTSQGGGFRSTANRFALHLIAHEMCAKVDDLGRPEGPHCLVTVEGEPSVNGDDARTHPPPEHIHYTVRRTLRFGFAIDDQLLSIHQLPNAGVSNGFPEGNSIRCTVSKYRAVRPRFSYGLFYAAIHQDRFGILAAMPARSQGIRRRATSDDRRSRPKFKEPA
jgi:hypothetical protein